MRTQYSGCGILCIVLFENLFYLVHSYCAVAAQKVIISHPGPGSWLCSCEYALVYGIYTVKGSPLQSFAVAIAVPMLHRMQSYKQGSMVQTSQQCLKTATALSH